MKMAIATIKKARLETVRYAVKPSSMFPAVLDPDGCYPYAQFTETAKKGRRIHLDVYILQNDHIKATVCPQLNGRLLSLVDKKTGQESLYRNDVIKPNRILPRWGWFSGGIEFNFPIAHSPTALEPVGFNTFCTEGRCAIQVGETERKYGLSWVVELSLGDNEDFLTQRVFLKNPGTVKRPWCLWSNAAVRSTPDTKYLFPSARVLRHSNVVDEPMWPQIGTREKDFDRMTGLFWRAKGAAFGVWHPEEKVGLLHMADPDVLVGMKMWTYGVGKHAKWPLLFCDNGRSYAEIQSGATVDQSKEMMLAPGEQREFIEFWKPLLREIDISKVKLPAPAGEFPPCRWIGNGHIKELRGWNELLHGYRNKASAASKQLFAAVPASPPPPLPEYKAPLLAAYAKNKRLWQEPLAVYLCAVGEFAQAKKILKHAKTAGELRIHGLLLWRAERNPLAGARLLWQAHKLSKDIHLACELDKCLVEAGDLNAREKLFGGFSSNDHRWIERKVDLLIAKNEPAAALKLLMKTKWDFYHLRQVRTELYKKCMAKLGQPQLPIPEQLGEDDMASWGAYRPQSKAGK